MIECVNLCSRIYVTSTRSVTIEKHTVDSFISSSLYSFKGIFNLDNTDSVISNSFYEYSVFTDDDIFLKIRKMLNMCFKSPELRHNSSSQSSLSLSKYLLYKRLIERSQYNYIAKIAKFFLSSVFKCSPA